LEYRALYPDTLLRLSAVDEVSLDDVRVTWKTAGPNWKRALGSSDVTGLAIAPNCRLPGPEDGWPERGTREGRR